MTVIDLTSDDEDAVVQPKEAEIGVQEVSVEGLDIDPQDEIHGPGGQSGDEEQWMSDSVFEDALEEINDEDYGQAGSDTCTLQEALEFRRRLREVGDDQFIRETLEAKTITAKKLITAFGIQPPAFLDGSPDEAYYSLLGLGITRELQKRAKIPRYNTIDDVVALLKESLDIIVLTGAGISTSLGIPDFRSKNTGLYSKLESLGLDDPQEVFSIDLFREDPKIFYSVAKDILPSTTKFSPTHAFIRLLQDKNKLLTNYTQNIDNIEGHAGILPEKLIQCHGSFATASCLDCGHQVKCESIYKEIKAGQVPDCERCTLRVQQMRLAPGTKRKRRSKSKSHSKNRKENYEDSTEDEEDVIPSAGIMKPDITFFGEDLPDEFHDRLVNHDRNLVDLVIVIGTSLKVAPVSEVVRFLPADVPQVYISRDPCNHVNFDVDMLGDCDVVVAELCRRAGWDLKHEMIPAGQMADVQLREGYESRYSIQVKNA